MVDATVAAGRLPLWEELEGAAAVALSAHQWGGPKGVGALWVKPGTRLVPLVHGGIQENGLRAGTENVAGILAAGAAAAARRRRLEQGLSRDLIERGRDLRAALARAVPDLEFTGDGERRLPGHVSCLTGVEGEALVLELSLGDILASTGSTCSRADLRSSVLKALGLTVAQARGSLVFSLDDTFVPKDAATVAERTAAAIQRLRDLAPPPETHSGP